MFLHNWHDCDVCIFIILIIIFTLVTLCAYADLSVCGFSAHLWDAAIIGTENIPQSIKFGLVLCMY